MCKFLSEGFHGCFTRSPNPTPAHPHSGLMAVLAASHGRTGLAHGRRWLLPNSQARHSPVCLILMAAWTHKVFDAKYNPIFLKTIPFASWRNRIGSWQTKWLPPSIALWHPSGSCLRPMPSLEFILYLLRSTQCSELG